MRYIHTKVFIAGSLRSAVSWRYTGARQVGVEQPGTSSSAPGSMCLYRWSVMPMLAWAMKAESAFALTPGRDHEARVGMARLVEG